MLTFTEVDEIPDSKRGRKSRKSSGTPRGDAYWFSLARLTARNATCPRKGVGIVIVRDEKALSCGSNKCEKKCTSDQSCETAVHAEVEAIKRMRELYHEQFQQGDKMYCTLEPCPDCRKLIPSYVKIYFEESYEDYIARNPR